MKQPTSPGQMENLSMVLHMLQIVVDQGGFVRLQVGKISQKRGLMKEKVKKTQAHLVKELVEVVGAAAVPIADTVPVTSTVLAVTLTAKKALMIRERVRLSRRVATMVPDNVDRHVMAAEVADVD